MACQRSARNGWFIGLLEYWRSDSDMYDVQLAFSRDGKTWQRPQPRSTFIPLSREWNKCSTNCAHSGPCFLNEMMAFYISGSSIAHHGTTTRKEAPSAWRRWRRTVSALGRHDRRRLDRHDPHRSGRAGT